MIRYNYSLENYVVLEFKIIIKKDIPNSIISISQAYIRSGFSDFAIEWK